LDDTSISGETNLLQQLKNAIKSYDKSLAEEIVKKMLDENIDPLKVFSEMTDTIRFIGDEFSKGIYFLPDLIGAGDVMTAILPIVEKEIKKRDMKIESLGNIVIGTVLGDIHSIGKTMVAMLLKSAGFSVYDIGINVCSKDFLNAIKKYDADILAMSALLTTTAPEMGKVIEDINNEGIRNKIKIIIGGGAITGEFASSIGVDGYDSTAPGAVVLAKRLLNK